MTNKLKLNDDKTEVVLFGTRQQLEKLESNKFDQQEILVILWNSN